jgi:hypothetical protein
MFRVNFSTAGRSGTLVPCVRDSGGSTVVVSAMAAACVSGGTVRTLDRVGALSGAASVLLVIIGSDVLGTAPGEQVAHPSGQQDLEHLRWLAATTSAQVGVSLELVGLALMIVFIGYVSARMGQAGWLSTVALAAGAIEVAVKFGSGAPMLAAYLLRDEISPQTARVLVDMNGVAFVLTWLPMGIFVASASAAGLVTGQLGRVLGWGGVVVGGASVIAAAAAGVHVLSAIFVPFVLCLLWVLMVSLRWGFARTRRTAARMSATGEPIPV